VDDGGVDGGDGAGPDWHASLNACWLDPTCHRALVVSHGGDWNVTDAPFLSRAAFEAADALGADGIEIDIRVTSDGVPVIAHSSPIEFYESLDCMGRKIEEMTADEVTACHLAPSLTQTFQRLDDVLDWADGRLILELDVKESGDLDASVQTIRSRGAQDRVYILVGVDEIQTVIPQIQGWEELHYMADIGDPSQLAPMLAIAAGSHVFLFEMDRSYGTADEAQVAALIADQVIPGGVKAFCSSDKSFITVQSHLDMYHQNFDLVLSYSLANGIEAARQVNVERGYAP
jgi:hypothetical protein